MAQVFGDYPEAMKNTLLIAERCNVTIPSGENHLPNFAVPEGFTLDDYFEHVDAPGLRAAARAAAPARRRRASCGTRSRSTTSGSPTRSR